MKIDHLNDRELLDFIERELYAAAVSDALDAAGYRHQAMRDNIRPAHARMNCVAGWARTIEFVDVYTLPGQNPYEKEIEALDSILPDELVVVSTQQSRRNVPWGELLSTASKVRGARGAVIDGLIRDVRKIEELGFPVFAAGFRPLDSAGRGTVISYNQPVRCGDVLVNPGDLVVADFDGIVAVPRGEVRRVIQMAADKVSKENTTRAELMRGAFLKDVWAKYGVL